MSRSSESLSQFERNARAVLEESVRRIDARTRSRLNQARHAALEGAGTRRRAWWRSLTLMPAAGAVAAALLVAVVLWQREPQMALPATADAQHAAVEDVDLLTDTDSIDLMEGWDGFYEWAAAQSDANGESDT
jgi:anti-sigma-K factor RskA